MMKQISIYLLLSMVVVLFSKFVHLFLVYINVLYTYCNVQITPFFNYLGLNPLIKKITLLVFLPVLLAGIPALIYRLIKRQTMPYYFELTWALWLLITLTHLLIR